MPRFANVSLKKYHLQVLLPLMASLFIYIFYRTDQTVVNELVLRIFTFESYATVKKQVQSLLPLNALLVYSLPEGLWVYSTTLVSKELFIKFRQYRLEGNYFSLIFSFAVEALQGLGLVKGTFDLFDIASATFFWAIAMYWTNTPAYRGIPILKTFDSRWASCVFCFSIVYLSYIWY
jgi:hypothetical protein